MTSARSGLMMDNMDSNQDGLLDFLEFCTLVDVHWTSDVQRLAVGRFFDACDVDGSCDEPTAGMRHVMEKLGLGSSSDDR